MPTHRQARKSGFSFSRNRMAALQVSPGSPASRSSCVGQRGRASSLRSIDYHSRTCLRQQKPGGKSAWSNACKPAQAHRPATRSRSLTQSLDARKGLFDARFARLSALPACAQIPTVPAPSCHAAAAVPSPGRPQSAPRSSMSPLMFRFPCSTAMIWSGLVSGR